MTKQLHQAIAKWFLGLLVSTVLFSSGARSATLSGAYTIDASQPASATNFQNLSSAITYLTSAGTRSDGGPSNSAPFGVSGAVTFDFATGTGPYNDQALIPIIPGASPTNNITINGNGCSMEFNTSAATTYHLIRLYGADYITINNLVLKTTNANQAIGVHFMQGPDGRGADSNTVSGCTIDLTAITAYTTNSAAIAFSNSTSSVTNSGVNGYSNLIQNNILKSATSSAGAYYFVTNFQSSSSIYSGNKFIGNTIENAFYMAYYAQNTNGTLIKDNVFNAATKTLSTTRYDIYCPGGYTNDTITGNVFRDPFGTSPSGNEYYGVYVNSGTNIVVSNNRFFNIRSHGNVYGLTLNSISNAKVSHNTLSFDYASSTATAGNYVYGASISYSNPVEVKNNNISIVRGGSAVSVPVYLGSTGAFAVNNNNYYVKGANASYGYYNGVYHKTMNSWQATTLFDTSSYTVNPRYTSATNLTITEAMLNNAGADVLAYVPVDAANTPRSTTPDIGAYEFAPINTEDAGVISIKAPLTPFNAGSHPVSVRIKNAGTNALTSVTINWSVNGTLQTPFSWTGSLNQTEVSADIAIGNYSFTTGTNHTIAAWTSSPNFSTDAATGNDSTVLSNIYTTLVAGTYTINQGASASATNFTSFNQLATALNGGITGPVVVNVVASSGPYSEQVTFKAIPGASATNTVTINGNNNTVQYSAGSTNYDQVTLNGAKHMTIQNLTIKALNNTYGWGIHFINSADSNKILNCTIDMTANISSWYYSCGIVFSSSASYPLSTGSNGAGNLLSGNTITGATNGGMYYGIAHAPASSHYTPANNKFINNTIQNFYNIGFYSQYSNGTLFKGNTIRNTNRTDFGSIYGVYIVNGSMNDTVINNLIEYPFGSNTTTTNEFYGIAVQYPGTQSSAPNLVANNIIRNVKSNGVQYGINGIDVSYNDFYHNSIILDNPASTSSSSTYGIFISGAPSGAVNIKNNVVYVNRPATNTNYNIYIGSASANFSINNNGYYKTATAGNIGYYGGTIANSFAQWQAVNSGAFDAAGKYGNPYFTNISTNAVPRGVALNGTGANVLTSVGIDFTGAARTATPDIGAYEYTPISLDAGVDAVIPPASPFVAGTFPVNVRIKNEGSTTLTSATINWSLNGVAQTPFSWTGSLVSGAVSANINVGSGTFAGATNNNVAAWTTSPNGGADGIPENDTIRISNIYTALAAGTYTIDKNAPASATNFTSFTSAAGTLNTGGITGTVTINVVAASGPYNEQVTINNIPGASASSPVTINGNNQELNFNNTSAGSLHIIGLNNTKHLVLNNLRIKSLNSSYGAGIIFTNNSDSNTIQGCAIDMSSISGTSSSTSAGIAFSGSFGSVVSGGASTGAANLIANNTIDGGAGNGCYYGIIINATNSSNPVYSHNKVIGNTVRDFYNYGIYLANSTRASIKNNTIYRPTKAIPSSFYGITIANGSQADTIENNLIYQPHANTPNQSNTVYGIYISSAASDITTPSLIKNNVINNLRGAGSVYGISNNATAYVKIYHNTVNISDLTSNSSSLTYGIHNNGTASGVDIKNNVVNIEKGGAGNKYALYFATTGTYSTNNNSLRSFGTSNAYVGYYSGSFTTITDWKTANSNAFDQSSVSANPLFRNQLNANLLQPGNDSLDNKGANLLTDVPFDYSGAARTGTPDLGAYEFITYPDDAGVFSFNSLGSNGSIIIPVPNTTLTLEATVKNYGTAALTSAVVNLEISGVTQAGNTFSGNLAKGDTAVVNLGIVTLGPGINQIKAWTTSPNGATDASNLNDTLAIRVCTPIAGDLSLNALWPDTGSNFTSFAALFSALRGCGVSGPVNIRVGAGTYAQQLTVPNDIPGHSSLNPITFDGIDSAICGVTHDGSISRATLLLNGAKNYVFRNMTFRGTSSSAATAVQLINSADSNTFVKCSFIVPSVANSYVNPFVLSADVNSPTSGGDAGDNLLVDSCIAKGGYYGGFVLQGSGSFKPAFNTISNSLIKDVSNAGFYVFYQQNVRILHNTITEIGLSAPQFYAYGIDIRNCDSANQVIGNYVYNMNGSGGFYGLYASQNQASADNRQVFANNVLDIGTQLINNTLGILDADNGYADIAYNTVQINTGDAAYGSAAYSYQGNSPAIYGHTRVVNNIFIAPNGALAARVYYPANVNTAQNVINYNVYFSTGVYPFYVLLNNVSAFITTTLTGFATNPNMMGTVIGNNTNSAFFRPQFLVGSKLRSLTPFLDEAAMPLSTVQTDIDGNVRNVTIPDIGAYEFTKTGNDAGVAVIVNPAQPLVAGLNDIKLAIRNYGLNPLTTCEVGYKIGNTIHYQTYNGNLATLAFDTVIFSETSGPGGTSQQYNFVGMTETIKAWTSQPNGMYDSIPTNDTASNTLCTGIAGNFTIDPAGSGPNNFLSVQAAIDKLRCGGVYGPVVFNVAAGTYTGQYLIPTIIGTSDTSSITFKSANNNAASVKFTYAPPTAGTNYVFSLQGVKYVKLEHLTLENTSSTYGRVVFISTNTTTNTTSNNIFVRNCIVKGPLVSSTADANALVVANASQVTPSLNFVNNQFDGGSMAIYASGPPIVNQFSPYLTIDSNTFNNQYYYGINLNYRSFFLIRKNTFNMANNAYYGLYAQSSGAQCVISDNTITNNSGYGYGIYLASYAYYNTPGLLNIQNNVINFMGGSSTQYGIGIYNSSAINMNNNTIRLNSSTTSYGVYVSGHPSFLAGVTNYPAAHHLTAKNNIISVQNGYAFQSANINADSSFVTGAGTDRNIYYSGNNTPVYAFGSAYDNTNFRSSYRNIFYQGSDARSHIANMSFVSATNLRPNPNNATVWFANGSAERITDLSYDITGAYRKVLPSEGTPDIGAYEVTPLVEPDNATIEGTAGYGSTQSVLVNGDTTAWITWGFGGTLPTSLTAKYYPGAYVSHPTQFPTGSSGQVLDEHWKISETDGSGYSYSIKFRYDPNHLGTIPSESDIRLAYKDNAPTAFWIPASFTNTLLDTIEKTFATNNPLYSMNLFTATTDIDPLPVKLASFDVRKEKRNGLLNWITAQERNALKFEIERSEDGASFAKVGEVKAVGNTSTATRYAFTDNNVADRLKGKQAFYRLKIVNRDGSSDYSEVRSISFNDNGTTVAVYPNPFNGALSIELNTEITKVDYVVVTDVYGKEVLTVNASTVNGSNKITLDQLSGLATGVYIVKSKINDVEYTHKVIKQ